MIKISKPPTAPAVLATRGAARRAEHCRDYDTSPAEYDAGKKFPFDATIYAHETVKQALIDAQHGKCCFCETIIREEGDVEHFRPKGGFRQEARARLEKPGYYWLAYEWNNLLLACSVCNQRHKKNLFPLVDPGKRVRRHLGDVSQEEPFFMGLWGFLWVDALLVKSADCSEKRCLLMNVLEKHLIGDGTGVYSRTSNRKWGRLRQTPPWEVAQESGDLPTQNPIDPFLLTPPKTILPVTSRSAKKYPTPSMETSKGRRRLRRLG